MLPPISAFNAVPAGRVTTKLPQTSTACVNVFLVPVNEFAAFLRGIFVERAPSGIVLDVMDAPDIFGAILNVFVPPIVCVFDKST